MWEKERRIIEKVATFEQWSMTKDFSEGWDEE